MGLFHHKLPGQQQPLSTVGRRHALQWGWAACSKSLPSLQPAVRPEREELRWRCNGVHRSCRQAPPAHAPQ